MSIGADLLRFSDQKITLADGECQRVNTMYGNLPFEWAWVVTRKGKILQRQKYYLNWGRDYRMSPDAARITRFNPEWVRNGDDPEFVLDAWESFALSEDTLLGGHNFLCFDVPLWMLWRRALGRPPIWNQVINRVIDSHLLARAYKEGFKPDRENLLAWQYKVAAAHRKGVKTGLSLMAKELGILVDDARLHGADYDLELNTAVLWKLINLMEI